MSVIRNLVNGIVQHFGRSTTLAESKAMLGEVRQAVQAFYRRELGSEDLVSAVQANPDALHKLTREHFGFRIYEQPSYKEVDDYAWEFSQRYTTLEGVTLPKGSQFFTSKRQKLSRGEVTQKMASGEYHLFDIALSNEYVLLGKDEKFNVNDIEQRFSTNNEHLPPQSGSANEGSVKVFRSDPRAIIISYSNTNSDRGHLQVVFEDENGVPRESIAMVHKPGQAEPELTRQPLGLDQRGARYPITIDDAPYYAYALALTHYANGFSQEFKKNWFDQRQAEEVVKMLDKLAENGVENNIEPVIRDALGDAKVLKGNINPSVALPEVYAAALQSEIDRKKFRTREQAHAEDPSAQPPANAICFAERYASPPTRTGVHRG